MSPERGFAKRASGHEEPPNKELTTVCGSSAIHTVSKFVKRIIEEWTNLREGSLTPREYSALYDVLHKDCEQFADAEQLYFVLGSYDDASGQRNRLEAVRDCISEYPPMEASLMEEIDSEDRVVDQWYLKFCAFYDRTDYAVFVFEDDDGGHELEFGEVSLDEKVRVLKRDYYSDGEVATQAEHDHYDGMLAKKFETVDNRGRLYRRTHAETVDCDNLDRATRRVVEDCR